MDGISIPSSSVFVFAGSDGKSVFRIAPVSLVYMKAMSLRNFIASMAWLTLLYYHISVASADNHHGLHYQM